MRLNPSAFKIWLAVRAPAEDERPTNCSGVLTDIVELYIIMKYRRDASLGGCLLSLDASLVSSSSRLNSD